MAIFVGADNSQELLDSIYQAIDEGTLLTWSYDADGDFFHDTPDKQWVGKAWLRPSVSGNSFTLNIVPTQNGVSTEAYAVYQGRFVEMLLAHFDQSFSTALLTAQPTEEDLAL